MRIALSALLTMSRTRWVSEVLVMMTLVSRSLARETFLSIRSVNRFCSSMRHSSLRDVFRSLYKAIPMLITGTMMKITVVSTMNQADMRRTGLNSTIQP